MRKTLFICVAFVTLFLSSCVAPEENDEVRFSVLGDSYSSYQGAVDPLTNDVWPYDSIGVTGPEMMWWHKVAVEMGWVLDKNNSFSGSLICNLNAANYYGPYSFIRRMNDLGDPDVIFVFGGTNDVFDGAQFGQFKYSGWTDEELCQIRPALAYLFQNLQTFYPRATVYFMLDMNLCSGGVEEIVRDRFIDSARRITSHYGVKCIDLYDIHKKKWHPDAKGMDDIARQVVEMLQADFNV